MEAISNADNAQQAAKLSPQRPEPTRRPSLLPAFEPLSSSPLPRASKRKYEDTAESSRLLKAELKYYPTPIPTSSTGVVPPSPTRRPALQRTVSTLSERTPLGSLEVIELPANSEPVLMGRSSNSSHHQLSANRLISRVHIRAIYSPPTALHASGEVVIECLGWNGATVHCRGQVHQLSKGESFSSDKPLAEIMLDVQDARVLVAWPFVPDRTRSMSAQSDATWTEQSTPTRRSSVVRERFASSPPPIHPRSPVSPSPANRPIVEDAATFLEINVPDTTNDNAVQVYEDRDSGDDLAKVEESAESSQLSQSPFKSSREASKTSQSSFLSSYHSDEFSDRDEENDPIIHSFYASGANLLPRMESFTTHSPQASRIRRPLTSPSPRSPVGSGPARPRNESPIKNHVINQLAFSRLHSIPLSQIFGNLPADLKGSIGNTGSHSSNATVTLETDVEPNSAHLTSSDLKRILDNLPCVGEIHREGKDAAGKPLENEFYYVPEMDPDQVRRDAVLGGRGAGLRSVRKSHKQYYWKRPRY